MTGGEIAAAAKAAEAIGKKVLNDGKIQDALLRVAETTPEMAAAARTMAVRTAVKERVKLKLWEPFALMLGVSRAYFEDAFPDEMGAKIANIPDENLITPPANVAVPALQGLSYTFEEPSLKQLYLNLLTTASDDRTSELAHPAFADIIKQLTPVEAVLLGRQLGEAHTPAARIRTVRDANAGGFVVLMKHLVPLLDYDTMKPLEEPQMSTWIDNWQRLGLVAVRYDEHEADPDAYDWVVTRPEYVRFAADRGQEVVQFDKGLVESTDFGMRFLRAVS